VKQYADLKQQMVRAFTPFAEYARQHRFPADDRTYGGVADGELAALERGLPQLSGEARFVARTEKAVSVSPYP
jgi:hypothetical protein